MFWKKRCSSPALAVFLLSLPAFAASTPDSWPRWRGPLANGVAPGATPPLTWSETENVKWKVSVPGFGTSTPIVWGNKVFILTAVAGGNAAPAPADDSSSDQSAAGARRLSTGKPKEAHQFLVLCYERASGQLLWQKIASETTPHEGHHPDHGFASGSPVTDGQVLIAWFGSRGLHCYDLQGNLKWSKDLGQMKTRNSFGEGSSPALHGDKVIVYWDDETDGDFIAAFDKLTGRGLWRTAREEPTGWSTPLVVEHGNTHEVVVNATGFVKSYDFNTGKELWRCAGQTANPIPTPVADRDTVYVTSGHRGTALYAIALGRSGDLTGTDAVRWSRQKNTPYVPSPLLVDDLLYTVTSNNPLLSCFNARTGEPLFEAQKLEGFTGIYASPVSAGDRVYVQGRNGTCVVLKKGPQPEVLATNKLDDKTDASLALVGEDVFVRGHRFLYCLRQSGAPAAHPPLGQ